eukprot:4427221-Alexandrium_andersonii.AAC.1
MSASLVGSEMCIRDRPPPTFQETRRGDGAHRPRTRVPTRGLGRPVGERAVSYTHLTLPTICSV